MLDLSIHFYTAQCECLTKATVYFGRLSMALFHWIIMEDIQHYHWIIRVRNTDFKDNSDRILSRPTFWERERERNVFIGNSTSWITYIQGAKYKLQVLSFFSYNAQHQQADDFGIWRVSYIKYKYNNQQPPCPITTQYTWNGMTI